MRYADVFAISGESLYATDVGCAVAMRNVEYVVSWSGVWAVSMMTKSRGDSALGVVSVFRGYQDESE